MQGGRSARGVGPGGTARAAASGLVRRSGCCRPGPRAFPDSPARRRLQCRGKRSPARPWMDAVERTARAGTGAPNPDAGSGISLRGELRLMLRAGLSSAAATSTPAGIFRIDERWRIGQSRSADLVLVDDYLAGRSLSDRETYLQVDPSGDRPGAGCSVPTQRHDHEVGHCTGLPGRQSAGRRHRRGTADLASPPASHR